MCLSLAKCLAGTPSGHTIAPVLTWAVAVLPSLITKVCRTFLNQAAEVQNSASAVNPALVELNDTNFCNLLTAYMVALPYCTSTPVRLLQFFSCAEPQFETSYALVWFKPPGFSIKERSEVPFKYCNVCFVAKKWTWQGFCPCAHRKLGATHKSRQVYIAMYKRLPITLRYLVASFSSTACLSIFLTQDFAFIGLVVGLPLPSYFPLAAFGIAPSVVYTTRLFASLVQCVITTSAFQDISWSSLHSTCIPFDKSSLSTLEYKPVINVGNGNEPFALGNTRCPMHFSHSCHPEHSFYQFGPYFCSFLPFI